MTIFDDFSRPFGGFAFSSNDFKEEADLLRSELEDSNLKLSDTTYLVATS
jgi:hypothetical protein